MSYSIDFRRKVLRIRDRDRLSFAKVAKRFDVGVHTVYRWSKNISPKTNRNRPTSKIDMEAFKQDVEIHPDSYLHERAERFGVTAMGIWHAIKRLGVTYKKNPKTSKSQRRGSYFIQEQD